MNLINNSNNVDLNVIFRVLQLESIDYEYV